MSEFAGEHGESQELKLSQEEIKMVAKLLSDPTYFPVEFRTWIKNFIEGAGITIHTSQIRGGTGKAVNLPAGIIIPYATTAIGTNVLPCDGSPVSRSFYNLLFEAIGTTWGPGDGVDTFNVPDLRDRALYGIGNKVGMAQTDGRALGSRGGPEHHHDVALTSGVAGGHGHTLGADGTHSHGGGVGGGGSHSHSVTVAQASYKQIRDGQQILQDAAYQTLGTIGTSGVGDHGHEIYADGSHVHSVNAVADHAHSVAGSSSGGFDVDKGSFAGVRYAITTGKAA